MATVTRDIASAAAVSRTITRDIATAAAISATLTRDVATAASVELAYLYRDVATAAAIWAVGTDPALFWPATTSVTYVIGGVRYAPNSASVVVSVSWTVSDVYGDGIDATFHRDLTVIRTAGNDTVTNADIVDALQVERDRIITEYFPIRWEGATDTSSEITTYSAGATAVGNNIWGGATQTFVEPRGYPPPTVPAPPTPVISNYNVTEYGAMGDDSTDDTAAIQATIAAATAAGGGTVVFPDGTYKITSAIVVAASGVRLLGTGQATLKAYTASQDIVQVGSATTQYANMAVENLTLAAGTTKSGGAAVALQNAVYTRLQSLTITNQYRGIDAYDKTFGTFISEAVITGSVESGIRYTTTGISSASNGLFLNNCVLDNPTGSQPTVAGINWINGEGLYAVNVEILRQKVGLRMAPTAGQGCKWGFFTNCLFDLCSSYGIEAASINDSAIFGNHFVNSWASTNGIYGIYLHPTLNTLDGMTFSSMRVLNNYGHGWYIGTYCDHVSIHGGEAIGNSATTANTTDGVYVEDGCDALRIEGLTSKGAIWGYANNQRYGINFAGTTIDNTIVTGCDLRSNGTGAFNNLPTTGEHRIYGNLGLTRGFLGGESLLFSELSGAPSGVTNGALIYAIDNGAGKTKLMAVFGTGAAVQIAIEP